MSTRRRFAALVAALATLAPGVAAAGPWIIEPTPEATDAIAAGADDVAAAQQLARQKKYDEAVDLLEGVAQAHPASAHDCNLALAYLRAGDLTRAQLLSDVAELRGGPRPDWCTTSLPAQLAQALRDDGYVPLTIDVTPADAILEVGGLTVRGVHLLYLPVSTYKVVARAEGYTDGKAPIVVAAPGAELTLALAPLQAPDPVVDPVDTVDGSGDLGELELFEPAKLPPPAPPPSWPGWVGVVGGGAMIALGAGFHVAALGTKDDANAVARDSMTFDDLSSTFARERGIAVAGYVVGTVALGFGIWWLTHRAGEHP